MEKQNLEKPVQKNATWKGFLIAVLTLLMIIPTVFLLNLVSEREARQNEVINEVSSKWAAEQTIYGPLIMIPYSETVKDETNNYVTRKNSIFILPESLEINGVLTPHVRHRSVYNVTLYQSKMQIRGVMNMREIGKLKENQLGVEWDKARLVLGITDARGLEKDVIMRLDGKGVEMEPGVPANSMIPSGLSIPVIFNKDAGFTFDCSVDLKGSKGISVIPVGKNTTLSLESTWPNPSFDGNFLPVTSEDLKSGGFRSNWKIMQASRPYPQVWAGSQYNIDTSAFGVKLIQPADHYAKTERSVKYSMLFISLTFFIFFFLEIIQKKQIHPVQYLLVGFALCIFYTLLLSISEYTGFNLAYGIAAAATIGLIGMYIYSIFRQNRIVFAFVASLTGLYTYIFILIQLKDYALLFGSIGLFIILAIIMYISRNINWYGSLAR